MPVIVVPVVMTPIGRRTLELAKQEARMRGADIVLIANSAVTENLVEDAPTLRDYLVEVEKDMIAEGFDTQSEWTVGSDLAQEVLAAARKHDAILIVLALRQRSPTGKALLGSYEQDILLDAPCPVLSVVSQTGV